MSICVRHQAANIDHSSDCQPINRFGIANGMAADDCTTHLGRLGQTTAQDGRNYSWPNEVGREPHDVERGQRATAHRKDIGKRVGRRDLSIRKWVVHNGCEKINRLHQGTMAIQAINAGIVECVRAHDYFSVQGKRKPRQNLSQGLLAQFGSSPGAR